jgi:hypothetical protein
MDITMSESAEPQVIFRPGRKRKAYRQRAEEMEPPLGGGENSPSVTQTSFGATISPDDMPKGDAIDLGHIEPSEEGLSVAEVIRLRNARKARLGGVAFRAGPTMSRAEQKVAEDSNSDYCLVLHSSSETPVNSLIGGVTRRFAPQTGLVGELVNKHM